MPKRSTTLSSIELEILTDVARGLNNNQIGMKRFRSPKTIRSEMKSIFAKLGARNRAHAVAIGDNESPPLRDTGCGIAFRAAFRRRGRPRWVECVQTGTPALRLSAALRQRGCRPDTWACSSGSPPPARSCLSTRPACHPRGIGFFSATGFWSHSPARRS
jgi:DNA-binding CsgD family transcriptional regulator